VSGALLGYLPSRWPRWFDPQPLAWQPLRGGPFASGMPLTTAGDVVVVPTPGHTPNHVSVVVDDGDRQIVLAGDTSYTERAMLDGAVDGVSPSETTALATLATLRTACTVRPTVYLPTHDPASAERLHRRYTARTSNL